MKKINGYYFGIKKDKSKNLYEVAVTNPEDHFQKYILKRSFARLLLFLIQSLFLFLIYSKSISVPSDGLIKNRLRLYQSLNRFYRKLKLRVYIAGKISGDKNYKKKFKKAERALKKKGHSVMNPAWLVEYKAFSWIDYMIVSEAMQRRCEAVLFLPDWKQSDGARIEHNRAKTAGQKILYSLNDL